MCEPRAARCVHMWSTMLCTRRRRVKITHNHGGKGGGGGGGGSPVCFMCVMFINKHQSVEMGTSAEAACVCVSISCVLATYTLNTHTHVQLISPIDNVFERMCSTQIFPSPSEIGETCRTTHTTWIRFCIVNTATLSMRRSPKSGERALFTY